MFAYTCFNNGSHFGYTNSQLNDDQAIQMAKEDIRKSSGYKDCGVTLLVKYKLSIESQKTYPDITKIPFSATAKKSRTLTLD